jgi:Fur family ferric uptake transcriptional regulator
MTAYSKDNLISLLKKAELRVTGHRLALLLYIARARQPVTVYELVDAIRKKEDIDQATIYRNLSSLNMAGLLRRLDFNRGLSHYELETGRASCTLVCSNCKTIEKIEGISVDDIIKKVFKKSRKFKSATAKSMEIYGLCKDCS